MLESLLILALSRIPIKNLKGTSFRIFSFQGFSCSSSVFAVLFLMGFANCGLCDRESVDSVPLGFEISGFDFDRNGNGNGNGKDKNLVSENGVFEFGFLERDGGSDVDDFVVGIRYNLGFKSANLPVWTIGGGVTVSINSTFRLSMDGRLILFDNPSNSVVWGSNTSNLGVQTATLLNTGNLVLIDNGNKVIWESFSHPTNTLLPGQSLHFPQYLRAPSTKSTTSYYKFVILQQGRLSLIWENNVTYWRSQLSSTSAPIREVRFYSTGVLDLYDKTNKVVGSISSNDLGDTSVNLRHLRIDQDGNLRIYSWSSDARTWRVGWQAVEDQCNVFGSCGLYSVCGYNSTGPICACLYPNSLDQGSGIPQTNSGGSGCEKMVDLGNCQTHTSMMVMKATSLYGVYPPHDVDIMLNEESCRDYCSHDTTCFASTSKNDGSGLCTLKRTSFISGYASPSIPSTSFVKVCSVPQAVAARGANPNLAPQVISSPFGAKRCSSKKVMIAILFVVFLTVSVLVTLEMFVLWFAYGRRQNKSRKGMIPFGKGAKMKREYSGLTRFSFKEVQDLTSSFSTQLGSSVFKGSLPDETAVVAKLLDETVVSEKEFLKAVSILGGTHHRNLVSLQGFCFEPKHKVLIYEYIPNGSMDKWLLDVGEDRQERNWQLRLDLAIGVARALAYLHTECRQCIIHGNLKLENVMLDAMLVPKVTDFGIQSFLQSAGSCSSSSSNQSPSEKDIYMLGKILLEIVLCSREIFMDGSDEVIDKVSREQKCLDSEDLRGVERVVRIALWCMQTQSFLRPSVGEVVKVLEGTLSVDRPPLNFAYQNDTDKEKNAGTAEIELEP